MGKARGVNPEDNPEPKSLRLSGADFGILLETYWLSPFLGVYQHCGEGDPLCGLQLILPP